MFPRSTSSSELGSKFRVALKKKFEGQVWLYTVKKMGMEKVVLKSIFHNLQEVLMAGT